MITRLWAKNYRSLADVNVSLEPLTVLVGINGSGKSNFVDVLVFINDALRSGLDNAVVNREGMGALRRWSAKGRPYDIEVGVHVQMKSGTGTYSFTLGSERRGEYRVKRESCRVRIDDQDAELFFETANNTWARKDSGVSPKINSKELVFQLVDENEQFRKLYEMLN